MLPDQKTLNFIASQLKRGMTNTTLSKIKKKILRSYKKHKDTIAVIGFVISILSLVLPFLIEERIVLIQRIQVIELPIVNEYIATPQETTETTASAYVIVERANGTREILKTYP